MRTHSCCSCPWRQLQLRPAASSGASSRDFSLSPPLLRLCRQVQTHLSLPRSPRRLHRHQTARRSGWRVSRRRGRRQEDSPARAAARAALLRLSPPPRRAENRDVCVITHPASCLSLTFSTVSFSAMLAWSARDMTFDPECRWGLIRVWPGY